MQKNDFVNYRYYFHYDNSYGLHFSCNKLSQYNLNGFASYLRCERVNKLDQEVVMMRSYERKDLFVHREFYFG